MKILLFIFVFSIIEGCHPSVSEEIENKYPTWVSPDGKAIIFQGCYKEKGITYISLVTWIERGIIKGGGGFFDIKDNKLYTLKVNWTSDSSACIEYPSTATIRRKDSTIYFAGSTIHFTYKIVN